jgi:hypothetical protein
MENRFCDSDGARPTADNVLLIWLIDLIEQPVKIREEISKTKTDIEVSPRSAIRGMGTRQTLTSLVKLLRSLLSTPAVHVHPPTKS